MRSGYYKTKEGGGGQLNDVLVYPQPTPQEVFHPTDAWSTRKSRLLKMAVITGVGLILLYLKSKLLQPQQFSLFAAPDEMNAWEYVHGEHRSRYPQISCSVEESCWSPCGEAHSGIIYFDGTRYVHRNSTMELECEGGEWQVVFCSEDHEGESGVIKLSFRAQTLNWSPSDYLVISLDAWFGHSCLAEAPRDEYQPDGPGLVRWIDDESEEEYRYVSTKRFNSGALTQTQDMLFKQGCNDDHSGIFQLNMWRGTAMGVTGNVRAEVKLTFYNASDLVGQDSNCQILGDDIVCNHRMPLPWRRQWDLVSLWD